MDTVQKNANFFSIFIIKKEKWIGNKNLGLSLGPRRNNGSKSHSRIGPE